MQLLQIIQTPSALCALVFHLETSIFPLIEDLDDPMEREPARPGGQTWHGRELHLSNLRRLDSVLESRLPNVLVAFHFQCLYYDNPKTPERLLDEFTGILRKKLPKLFERERADVLVELG